MAVKVSLARFFVVRFCGKKEGKKKEVLTQV